MQKIPGGFVMKTLTLAILSTAIVLTSCSSSKQTAASEYDDVDYNPLITQIIEVSSLKGSLPDPKLLKLGLLKHKLV